VPDLSPKRLVTDMLAAVKASLGTDWPKARDYARPEFQRLATSLVDIGKLVLAGKVNEQQARALLAIHRNTTQIVLLTIEGLGVIAVENAINAALDAIRTTVNRAVKFALL
jgi:hypothetical protein